MGLFSSGGLLAGANYQCGCLPKASYHGANYLWSIFTGRQLSEWWPDFLMGTSFFNGGQLSFGPIVLRASCPSDHFCRGQFFFRAQFPKSFSSFLCQKIPVTRVYRGQGATFLWGGHLAGANWQGGHFSCGSLTLGQISTQGPINCHMYSLPMLKDTCHRFWQGQRGHFNGSGPLDRGQLVRVSFAQGQFSCGPFIWHQ